MAEPPVIDVERLVAELQQRLAAQRAAGAYADDLSGIGLELGPIGPTVRFRPELGFSSKPVVGPLITAVKRLQLRMLHFVLQDLADQTDAAIGRVEAQAADAASRARDAQAEVERLGRRIAVLEEALGRAVPQDGAAKPGRRPG
jgi:hypothetical protein